MRGATAAPLTLAPVGSGDEAEILALARAFHAEDGHPLDAGGERAVREVCAGHPLARGFLLREGGGATVGYCVLTLGFGVEYGGADVFLDDLYLVPDARGRGLGRAAMVLIEAEALPLGARAVHLVVAPGNGRARRLYQDGGFEPSDWLVMSKRL